MGSDRFDLPLRIVVEAPVPGLALARQRGASGKATLVPPMGATPEAVTFELDVTVEGVLADGRPRLLGPYVQGPPAERFVYIVVGDVGRIKVPLRGLSWPLIETLPAGGRVEARISGRNPKGGPALATVPILPPGWTAAS